MNCFAPELLERFLAGELNAAASAAVVDHVEDCHACQRALERTTRDESLPLPDTAASIEPDEEPPSEFLERLEQILPPEPIPQALLLRMGRTASDDRRSAHAVHGTTAPCRSAAAGYEILGELGRGGMGIVYKARQIGLNRLVALKMVRAGAHAGPAERARFQTEAEALARLHHPNLVQIHDVGEADGCPYYAMELVDGPTLAEACQGRPQPVRASAELIQTLARAVAVAHARGVLHRDLKPANILLQRSAGEERCDGRRAPGSVTESYPDLSAPGWVPKVVDFGLAKRLDDVSLTRDGLIVGTPGYLAPEQASLPGRPPSPAIDIYALGAILYKLLTGRAPFLADSVEATLALVANQEPVAPRRLLPNVPRDLETICLKCLAKDPVRRYAAALDLADDLGRFLANQPIRARPTPAAERLALWARRHRAIAASLAMTVLLLLATTAGSLVAAAHFQRLKRQAELAGTEARASQRTAELTLADMHTMSGLQSAGLGRDREAALWFARAARLASSDPQRRWANTIRTRTWSRRSSQPVAVLRHPAGVPLSLEFHPGGGYLLSTPAPYPGTAAVWDVAAEQSVPLPASAGDASLTVAAWSPDGAWLAVGTPGGVTLYRFPGLTEPRRLIADGGPTLLRFSRDGSRLAMAHGSIVRVWDRSRGALVAGTLAHSAPVLTMEFTSESHRLVTADEAGDFRVFSLGTGDSKLELTGRHQQFGGRWTLHGPWIDAAGRRLASVTSASELTWWDLTARARLDSIHFPEGEICHVATNPDRSLLAVNVENLGVAILDAATRTIVARLKRGQGGLLFSAFRPDGQTLVMAGAHPEAQQWSVPDGAWLDTPAVEATGFRAAAFSRDGQRLATVGYENQIRIWELASPDPPGFAVPTGDTIGRGTFSADAQFLLARLRGNSARVHRVTDGSPVGPPLRPDGALVEAAFSPNAGSVVTAADAPGGGGLIDVWDAHSSRRRAPTLRLSGPPLALDATVNGRLAVLCRDGLLHLIDAPTVRVLRKSQCGATRQPREDVGVSLSADGRAVLVWINGTMQLRDGASGRLRFPPLRHPELLYAALSGDGRLIASVGADSALRFWDAGTGQQRGPALEHPSWLDGGLQFHPDSRHVLTICKDAVIRVWDAETGRLAAAPIQPVCTAAARFTPDGRAVVSAGASGTVEVWDWRTSRPLLPPRPLTLATDWAFNGNRTVEISADGRLVAVGGRPALTVLELDDLYRSDERTPEDLEAWAELLSHHRVHEGGTLAHLTGEEFLGLWRALRHSLKRPGQTVAPAEAGIARAAR
jgi:serine/threonine protein kinase/WD40 repeat protein